MDAAQHLGARSGVNTVDVWAGNADDELQLLRALVGEFPVVAVAANFPRVSSRLPPAATVDGFYQGVRADVDALRVVQLGLAIGRRDGEVGRAWRFHLCKLAAEDPRFLARIGADVDDRLARSVDPHRLGDALVACHAVLNPEVTWIARDAEDAAYMVRCLTGGLALPPTRQAFLRLCAAFFPVLYDQEMLTRSSPTPTGAQGAAST